LRRSTAQPAYYGRLDAYEPDVGSCSMFHVIDWQSLVFLPKYVAFKGDNDLFLTAYPTVYPIACHEYLQFSEPRVEDNPMMVGSEIVQTSDGNICIRNLHYNKYWRLSPTWIWADSNYPTSSSTVFEPIKINDDTIALRSVANNSFCTRLTSGFLESCLDAGSSTINTWAKLKVSELVISREIENVNFKLMDARIYGESIIRLDGSSNTNHGSETHEQTFALSYKDSTLSTWNWNVSLKAGVETSFSVGIPFISEGSISLGYEVAGQYTWGETKEVVEERSFTYKVLIPPKTKVTVRLMSTRGTCDVPFTYTQRELLYTGEIVTTETDGGVYTGVNNYSYYTEVKEEPLTNDPNIEAAGFKKVAKVSPSGEITPI